MFDNSSPQTVYANAYYQDAGPPGGVFKSLDGAATWNRKSSGFRPRSKAPGGRPGNTAVVYASTEGGMFRTIDGAESWWPIQTGLPQIVGTSTNVVTAIAIDPLRPSTIYAGTFGGGVYRSVDRGDSWTPFNVGLTRLDVVSLAISSDGRFLHAGTPAGVFSHQISAASFHTLVPCRLADTRDAQGPSVVRRSPRVWNRPQALAAAGLAGDVTAANVT